MSKEILEDYLLYRENTRAAAPNSRGMVVRAMRFLHHHLLGTVHLKNVSTCQRQRYRSAMVAAGEVN